MIKQLSIWTLIVLLSACASQPQPQQRYRLPHLATASDFHCTSGQRQVQVSGFLNRSGLVLQTSDNQWHTARQHLWIEPLQVQLQESLARMQVRGDEACQQPLLLTITAFYGDADGQAVVAGYWQSGQERGEFYQTQALADDGYDALVTALDQAWTETLTDLMATLADT
ncbi:PqiC family protein [Idiomarina xiamenensis]|uniref:ABC-type transport auxiliary lipoprotein component domain-containing protein n=1 Tax=Idiomarina xiamenensis 10-D-4 TaxID=740709 RepID=K2KBC2_9GAMM|nr:ABC-type transport auxiliary lipoprotein family protein [Idiomarina xiamenensis]EKE83887.1 hypothetical protein A10D4_07066 [Idiomarina xiamenensis 10-D-4]